MPAPVAAPGDRFLPRILEKRFFTVSGTLMSSLASDELAAVSSLWAEWSGLRMSIRSISVGSLWPMLDCVFGSCLETWAPFWSLVLGAFKAFEPFEPFTLCARSFRIDFLMTSLLWTESLLVNDLLALGTWLGRSPVYDIFARESGIGFI